ncbi:MAG: secretion protein HlyD [Thermoguttaceae bacterium]
MKKVVILLVLVSLGIGAFFIWQHIQNKAAQENRDFLTLYGNVEIRRVNLGFRVSGRITEILFKEGDRIEKGAVIAKLDQEPFEDSLAVASAQVATAEANYEKLKAGNRPQEIEQARSTLNQKEATLKVLETDFERAKQLVTDNTVTQQEYDTALARRDEAVAQKQLAEETLNLLLEGFRAEDIAVGASQLAEAKANFKRLQTSLKDTELICPNNGILLTRVEEPGAVVNPGQTIVTLSLKDEVWVYVYIPEKKYGIVKQGMKAEIYTDSAPDKPYTGQVGYISPEAEFTPKTVQTTELRTDLVYRVRIIADTPDNGLCQGMPVTVKLLLNR